MLDTIAHIGNIMSKDSDNDIFDFIIDNNSRLKHCIALDFDLESKCIKFDLLKSDEKGLSAETFTEYALLPNEKGNRPQFFATCTNLEYLVSQSLPNLAKMLPAPDLACLIDKVIRTFFIDTQKPKDSRYGKMIDPQFFPDIAINVDNKDTPKEIVKEYSNNIAKTIEEQFSVKEKECFYTVCINSEPIVQSQDYRNFIKEKFFQSAFDENRQDICTICGKQDQVTANTTRFLLKFYVTDKLNFASFFDEKKYYKAVSLCPSCYQHFILGEKWIASHLRSRLGGFSFYLIPQFLIPGDDNQRIVDIVKNLPDDFNQIKNIKETSKRQDELDFRFRSVPFVLNFLFYKKSQSAFKILNLVKDVPPYRLLLINQKLNKIGEMNKRINIPDSIHFGLDQIYWLVPIRKKGAEHREFKKVLHIYYNLFSGIPMQKSQLLTYYVELAHMHRFESYKLYQIGAQQNPEWALMSDTLKWNLFLLFLYKLDLLGGNQMESPSTIWIPERLDPVLKEFGYSPAQQGLALLGYVLESAAYAQYKEGLKNKPVLGKLNYQGMTHEKVMRLFNDLYEKINQYRKHIGYAERYLASGQQLYLSDTGQTLSAHERVFYILSGYSFHLLETKNEPIEEGVEA
jgi:CRISPR-associated protein Csh1